MKANYEFAFGGVYSKVTLVLTSFSACRLAFDFFQISPLSWIERLLTVYRSLFHPVFELALSWLPINPSPALIDGIIVYLTLGFIVVRVVWMQVIGEYQHPWILKHNYNNSRLLFWMRKILILIRALFLWPIEFMRYLSRPHLVTAYGAHGPSKLETQRLRPDPNWAGHYHGNAILIMLIRLGVIVSVVLLAVAANYGFTDFSNEAGAFSGPSGQG